MSQGHKHTASALKKPSTNTSSVQVQELPLSVRHLKTCIQGCFHFITYTEVSQGFVLCKGSSMVALGVPYLVLFEKRQLCSFVQWHSRCCYVDIRIEFCNMMKCGLSPERTAAFKHFVHLQNCISSTEFHTTQESLAKSPGHCHQLTSHAQRRKPKEEMSPATHY